MHEDFWNIIFCSPLFYVAGTLLRKKNWYAKNIYTHSIAVIDSLVEEGNSAPSQANPGLNERTEHQATPISRKSRRKVTSISRSRRHGSGEAALSVQEWELFFHAAEMSEQNFWA